MFGMICVLAETKNVVVYYVSPTEPLSSCPGNSSCPSAASQLCHTMDYLAEHSSEFFSPDQVNVTLILMYGIHNYTKDLTVQNLHSFIMRGLGAAQSRENVIIDHQFGAQVGKCNCTLIRFFNVTFVNITNLTMSCNKSRREPHHIVKSSSLYGYPGIKETYLSSVLLAEVHKLYWTTAHSKKTALLQVTTVMGELSAMAHFSHTDIKLIQLLWHFLV